MIKNTASQRVGAQMVSAADGSAFTGSVTVSVTVDAGTQATGSVGSGACVHEGNGYHSYAPAQAETNGDLVAFTFTGTGAIPTTVQVYTVAGDAFTRLGAPAGASVSADVAAIKAETATILSDTNDIQTRIPAALVGGRIDANVGAISGDATAADNLEAAADGTGYNLGGGSVVAASVTGAVGSVTGSVGSVAGSVASIASGGITAASFAADSITAAKLAADVTTELQSGLATAASITALDGKIGTVSNLGSGATLAANLADIEAQTDDIGAAGAGLTALASAANLATVAGYLDTEIAAIKAKTDNLPAAPAAVGDIPTAAVVADAVWDEALSGHAGAGSTGEALSAAGAAGDPWATALPGSYGSGTAGKIIGDNLNATVSSRLAAASYTAPLDAAGVRTAVGLASANLDTQLAAIDDAIDTEVGAIKAKTDQLTFTTANQVDARVLTNSDKTGYAIGTGGIGAAAFASGAIDAAALNADAIDEILDEQIGDSTVTMRQALKLMAAVLGGKVSGAGTATITFRNVADTTDVVVASVDGAGNRTAITRTL